MESDNHDEQIDFNEVIDALLDSSSTFPPRLLYQLSGLESLDLEQLTETWNEIDPLRRQRLLEDLEVLADSNYRVNFESVFKLGLGDSASQSRRVSIRGLWENEDSDFAATLISILIDDPDPDVRAEAANGLGKFVYLGELDEIEEDLYTGIKSQLFEVIEGSHPDVIRRRALEAIGFSGEKQASILIEEAYNTDKEDWLISAIIAMGRSADTQWVPQIIENLPHENEQIRLEAAQAAGLLSAQETVPHLLQLIDDPEDDVRKAAIWSLSEIGGMDARAALEGLLKISNDEELMDFLEEALENLDFSESQLDFDFYNLSEEDLEEMISEDEENQED